MLGVDFTHNLMSLPCRLLSQLIGLTDFIFSQDCRDELEKLTAATTAKAQVGMCWFLRQAGRMLEQCEAAPEQKVALLSEGLGANALH